MGVNNDKPTRWKQDIAASVDLYNRWFLREAPDAFRRTRTKAMREVEQSLLALDFLVRLSPSSLVDNPGTFGTLRMATVPPLAVDRVVGLSGVPKSFVQSLEQGRVPPRLAHETAVAYAASVLATLRPLLDPDLFVWLADNRIPDHAELERASVVVADRLCGAQTDPIIRNAQELRQLQVIAEWLNPRGYVRIEPSDVDAPENMKPGSYCFHLNLFVTDQRVKLSVDAAIQPRATNGRRLPILLEAKSAGDFTNVNKRRKEEAQKVRQMRSTYGQAASLVLFLGGYFDSGYLGYEAAEGLDWVWEHRPSDLEALGL